MGLYRQRLCRPGSMLSQLTQVFAWLVMLDFWLEKFGVEPV